MNLILKDMDMSDNCEECRFYAQALRGRRYIEGGACFASLDDGDDNICKRRRINADECNSGKPEWCPLHKK